MRILMKQLRKMIVQEVISQTSSSNFGDIFDKFVSEIKKSGALSAASVKVGGFYEYSADVTIVGLEFNKRIATSIMNMVKRAAGPAGFNFENEGIMGNYHMMLVNQNNEKLHVRMFPERAPFRTYDDAVTVELELN